MIIAQSADNHLGCRLYSSSVLQEDYRLATMEVIEQTIARGVSLLVLSGDLLHTSRTGASHPYALKAMHERAKEAGLVVLAINGNHDRGEVSWAKVVESKALNDGDVVSEGGLYCVSGITVTVRDPNGDSCRVHGCNVAGKEALRAYTGFTPCDVFLYHGPVFEFFSLGNVEAIPSIADFPWDRISKVVALGDIHKTEVRKLPDGKFIGYPGSTHSTQKSEDPEKCFFLYDLSKMAVEKVPVVIERKTLKMSVFSDKDLEALKKILSTNKKWLLHITYPGEQYHLLQRLRHMVNLEDVFIDPNPVYISSAAIAAAKSSTSADYDPESALHAAQQLSFEDVLRMMTGGTGPLFDLVSGLAAKEVEPLAHLDSWVNHRMKELGMEDLIEDPESTTVSATIE